MQVTKTRRHYEHLIRERTLKHNRILKELIVRDVANIFARSSKTWNFNEKVGRNKVAKKMKRTIYIRNTDFVIKTLLPLLVDKKIARA